MLTARGVGLVAQCAFHTLDAAVLVGSVFVAVDFVGRVWREPALLDHHRAVPGLGRFLSRLIEPFCSGAFEQGDLIGTGAGRAGRGDRFVEFVGRFRQGLGQRAKALAADG